MIVWQGLFAIERIISPGNLFPGYDPANNYKYEPVVEGTLLFRMLWTFFVLLFVLFKALYYL
jgi:hypothetical protein